MISRWAKSELVRKMKVNRVVSVVGCRQSGKTTLLLNAPFSEMDFKSLDDAQMFEEAKLDPKDFVTRLSESSVMVIDEVQKALSLIGQIKYEVDRNPKKGQYIISGTADYRRLPQANESLAGRAGFVRVRTFCEVELRGKGPGVLAALLAGRVPPRSIIECSKRDVVATPN